MEERENIFKRLSSIDCLEHVEKKNNLTYLSWVWAWGITKTHCQSANYKVLYFEGKPYLFDENLGYIVSTEVTIDGETIPMHLPVMDNSNKAMKNKPYTYKTRFGEKIVEAATMFDINTAIMRCLTKNLAMFGLGHYIYAGEDLPKDIADDETVKPKKTKEQVDNDITSDLKQAKEAIGKCKNSKDLLEVWNIFSNLQGVAEFKTDLADGKEKLGVK